tara:strand:- start:426 stop:743 length:318 start_codon:yes stop_codon:yes gene_type:complete
MAPPILTWIAANQALLTGVGALAGLEGVRKSSVAGSIQRRTQEREAKKAEKRQQQELRTQSMIRQEEKKRQGMTQKSSLANPLTIRKSIKEQFTKNVDQDSGVNY